MFPVRCLRDFGCAAALLAVFCGTCPRRIFPAGKNFGAQCFRSIHCSRRATNFGAGQLTRRRHQHRFRPARTRAAGCLRRTHQAVALARTWISDPTRRSAEKFFWRCTRRSRSTRKSSSFQHVVRRRLELSGAVARRFVTQPFHPRAGLHVCCWNLPIAARSRIPPEIPAWLADGLSQQLLARKILRNSFCRRRTKW